MLKLFNLSLFILVMNIYASSSNNLESGSNNKVVQTLFLKCYFFWGGLNGKFMLTKKVLRLQVIKPCPFEILSCC